MILMHFFTSPWMDDGRKWQKRVRLKRSTDRKGENIPLEFPIFVTSVPPYDIVRTYHWWTKCNTHKRISNRLEPITYLPFVRWFLHTCHPLEGKWWLDVWTNWREIPHIQVERKHMNSTRGFRSLVKGTQKVNIKTHQLIEMTRCFFLFILQVDTWSSFCFDRLLTQFQWDQE